MDDGIKGDKIDTKKRAIKNKALLERFSDIINYPNNCDTAIKLSESKRGI